MSVGLLTYGESITTTAAAPRHRRFLLARWSVLLLCMAISNCRVEGDLAIDGVTFRNTSASLPQVSPGQQPFVQASSQCVWTGAHEPLSLSWEAIVSGTYHGNASINGQHLRVATCDNSNADTGADTFDGVRIGGYFKTYKSQIPTKVLACPQSGSNPLGDCRISIRTASTHPSAPVRTSLIPARPGNRATIHFV